jgi:hypothetical protein
MKLNENSKHVVQLHPVKNTLLILWERIMNGHKGHCWYDSNLGYLVPGSSVDKFIIVILVWAGHSGRAVWGVGLGRLVAGIVGSNPA